VDASGHRRYHNRVFQPRLRLISLYRQQPASQAGSADAALTSLDARQKDLVAKADVDGFAALAAPQLTINAPTNRILTRKQFLAMMRDGRIGAEAFERKVESVTVSGPIGVVMGSEVFTPDNRPVPERQGSFGQNVLHSLSCSDNVVRRYGRTKIEYRRDAEREAMQRRQLLDVIGHDEVLHFLARVIVEASHELL
jgi:hypothetical protein